MYGQIFTWNVAHVKSRIRGKRKVGAETEASKTKKPALSFGGVCQLLNTHLLIY